MPRGMEKNVQQGFHRGHGSTPHGTRTGWQNLPNELRIMIFSILRESERTHITNYVTTCKQWQRWFEPESFHTIHLDQHKLPHLESVIGDRNHRQLYVQKISFVAKLSTYDCSECMEEEDEDTAFTNSQILFRGMRDLFAVLSSWSVEGRGGICLEIGARSPSDAQHGFREYRFEKSSQMQGPQSKQLYKKHLQKVRDASDACPSWNLVRRGAHAPYGAKRRVLSTLLSPAAGNYPIFFGSDNNVPQKWYRFPRVEVISTLQVRRHGYRRIAFAFLRELASGNMPNLRTVRYERWHHPVDPYPTPRAMRNLDIMVNRGLENFSVFCDHGEPINQEARLDNGVHLSSQSGYGMPMHIVFTICRLRRVCLSFVIEPEDFFWAARRIWSSAKNKAECFPNLESLSMTCGLFCLKDSSALSDTLVDASDALYLMPKLKSVTLWNGGKRWGSYLHLDNTRGPDGLRKPSVTYASTRDLTTSAVISAWKASFEKNRPGEGCLQEVTEKLDKRDIQCAAGMLDQLPDSSLILTEQSKAEMQLEGTARNAFERIGSIGPSATVPALFSLILTESARLLPSNLG
ncbi:uncharacterized protein F5Z01DRAFT_366981 [Emericellopsis atlantica]|uniref:DUF6546 domain-containing protein n=1 Tax=Emericellopsis atlantica TaxID=2614577 RepID=A0A9P7ZF71_9HYPO|nr:uncharacterized protein F5Z01DRAFT_366981 [Emericellopsis atlantica]KAG9250460.1 hypothetical protein F5Z01DRAFT_366981 [Emericellopsis atlantica]